MTIRDKVVVITGASSGIGAATAVFLARKGAKLALGARREDKLKLLKNKIKVEGGEAYYLVMDVTKREDNESLISLAKEKYGRVDVTFLNAGLMPNSPLSELKSNEWKQMIDVNLVGVLNGVEAVLPEYIERKSGQIITISSVAGLKSYPGGAVYGATKWAVKNLMEVLRMESAQEGTNIRTSTIYPAAINTELLETISDKELSKEFQQMYNRYSISPERVAEVVAFAIDQPEDTTINEFTIGPANQPW